MILSDFAKMRETSQAYCSSQLVACADPGKIQYAAADAASLQCSPVTVRVPVQHQSVRIAEAVLSGTYLTVETAEAQFRGEGAFNRAIRIRCAGKVYVDDIALWFRMLSRSSASRRACWAAQLSDALNAPSVTPLESRMSSNRWPVCSC